MRPDFGIIDEKIRGEFTELYIDPNNATIKGRKLKDTGLLGKRKFENILIITRPKERLKVLYKI